MAVEVYLRNQDFIRPIWKFCEISGIILLMFNNKKFTYENLKKNKDFNYNDFIDTFYDSFDNTVKEKLSIIPLFCIKNIFNTSIMVR